MSNISVLIIDDETAVQKAVSAVLKREQMDVSCAGSGPLALDILKENTFDIILLDVIMPEQDGFDLLAELRRRRIYTPVILLSGKTEDAAQVEGLGLGADDYITKPFSKTVLVSKIQAIVRRTRQYVTTAESIQSPIQKGPFTLHMNSQTIFKHGKEIALTSKEFALLCLFMDHPGHTFSKQQLFQEVWKNDGSDNNTILVYIKKLRSKIEDDPSQPFHIRTVWGKGYQFFL